MPDSPNHQTARDAHTEGSGAERIRRAFHRAKADSRCALLPFVTAGYPSLAATKALLAELPTAGADLIEIGFPFSDPIADGPVIAESMHHALCSGVDPEAIFDCVAEARPTVPVLAMVSHSIVHRMGTERFIARAVESGFAGFIVPDCDPADARMVADAAAAKGAGFCALVSPTTTDRRMRELVAISSGFVYLLARAGVTGVSSDAPEITSRAAQIRAATAAPIAAGFGISTAEHVRSVGRDADGAIVGSAIVRAMTEALRANEDRAESDRFAAAVRAATSLVRSLRTK